MENVEKKIEEIEKKIETTKTINSTKFIISEMKKIGIEKLPYSYSALKPFIDSETMKIHYTKHYLGYVEKLNKALNNKSGDKDLEGIIKTISKYNKEVRNNAGGAFNHALFWNMLTPTPKKLKGQLLDLINNQFGTFTKFKREFEEIAKERFGSGWVWLVITAKNTLKIMSTPNQDNPLMNVVDGGGFPLLGLDLWEHAYYLKYRNQKDDYIKNFWKVVNWDFVSDMFEMKTKTKLVESDEIKTLLGSINNPRFCTPEEKQGYKITLYDDDLRDLYKSGVTEILKSVFPKHWVEANTEDLSGFYGYESESTRSVLSNLNTNYNAFCLLTNALNKLTEAEKFDFNNAEKRNIKEMQRYLNQLNKYKFQIFSKKNSDFINIIKVLVNLWERGQKTESGVLEKIQKFFGSDAQIEKLSRHGSKKDALGGIDLIIKKEGEELTAQVKPYNFVSIKNNQISVFSTGDLKKYSVDLLIFQNTKTGKILIFKNEPLKISKSYDFKSESLLYEIE